MAQRQPNRWTADEDAILYQEATKQASFGAVKDWSCIAELLPGRTNKDCRKRWVNKVCGGLKRGTWSEAEDRMLRAAVNTYGQRWTLVAKTCIGRSPDQCAKRWQFTLDPKLEHREWTTAEDELLVQLVKTVGRDWKLLCKKYFPTRSRNNLRNRYSTLTRRPLSEPGTSDAGNTESSPSLAGAESNAEHTLAGDPESLADAPLASSEYPDPEYAPSLWHADGQAARLGGGGGSPFDGETLLDLDMDFASLFSPLAQPGDSCEHIGALFSNCRGGALPPPAINIEPLVLDLAQEDRYGAAAAKQPPIRDASSGESQYGSSPFSDDWDVATFCATEAAMQGVGGAAAAAASAAASSQADDSGAGCSVAKVVLLVEECDADTLRNLIDVTRRLRGKAKIEITA